MGEHDEVEIGAALEHRLRVRALGARRAVQHRPVARVVGELARQLVRDPEPDARVERPEDADRSEEHTSELQSQSNLVCRLLLEKKKKKTSRTLNIPNSA